MTHNPKYNIYHCFLRHPNGHLIEIQRFLDSSLLSLNVTAFGLARILGALAGGWLWQWHSIALHATVGAVCALGAALLLAWGMTEVT